MITILLPCYNGSRYIRQQIESILKQSHQDFVLYINDDCSADDTFDIVSYYAENYPDKVVVSRNSSNLGSAQAAFMQMMSEHQDSYVMLSDQDDVWHRDKIEKTYAVMKKLEAETEKKDIPLLVHSDLCVVDEALRLKFSSYKTYMKTRVDQKPFSRMLIQNAVSGCTIMYNGALGNLIRGNPGQMMMHDWWLMLIAGAFGKTGYLPEATIDYRQHGGNDVGMEYIRTTRYKIHKLTHKAEIDTALMGTYQQAQAFMETYQSMLSPELLGILQAYCEIPAKHKIGKWQALVRGNFFKDGMIRNIALMLFV